uniref:Ground-like domain-containing protein n=1 Tax=Parascaris equorum TaxID=6256 RepID=A0A914R184_PAREQ
MHGARVFSSKDVEVEDDPTCNDVKLKTIMQESCAVNITYRNLTKDATVAKRSIQKAIEEKFSAKFNVICANGDFSYVAYTETYCQTSNDDVTCYAFKPL